MAGPALLDVERLTVRFGGLRALDAVSLQVQPGQVVGLIGPNGAGKTTLFNVVCGFVRPDEGQVRWQGQQLRTRPHGLARLGIARTLQSLGLFEQLTVLDNVMVGAEPQARAGFVAGLLALPRGDRDERALRDRALGELRGLDLAADAHRLAGQLPYGMRKRVALARALVAQPRLLLLDEPASGLSGEDIRALADLVGQLSKRMSVMLVEHHMDLVMGVCDAVVVLDFGRVIAEGPPEVVRADPAVVEAYLGAAVEPSAATVDRPDAAPGPPAAAGGSPRVAVGAAGAAVEPPSAAAEAPGAAGQPPRPAGQPRPPGPAGLAATMDPPIPTRKPASGTGPADARD